MKFQIIKTETGEVIATIEAASKVAALKGAFSTRNGKITVARKADWKDNVYSAGHIGCDKWNREFYTVTEVVEATPDVIAEVVTEENVFSIMTTYTDAQLMDIVTTHSLRRTIVDQRITEAAARELAGR